MRLLLVVALNGAITISLHVNQLTGAARGRWQIPPRKRGPLGPVADARRSRTQPVMLADRQVVDDLPVGR
jgi:hypothetical protein